MEWARIKNIKEGFDTEEVATVELENSMRKLVLVRILSVLMLVIQMMKFRYHYKDKA